MRSLVLAFGVTLLVLPATAQAHFTLTSPPPASSSGDGGKGAPPCGPTGMASNVITPVIGGSKLMVKVNETVYHPGFYRIALSLNSRSELPADNIVKDKNGMVLSPTSTGESASAEFQNPPVFPVLADNLWPHTSTVKMFETEITLPNVTCAKCTLQVIEFMAEHGANTGGGFFYHHCADLKITADPNLPPFTPGAGGAGGAGGASAAGAGGASAGSAGASAGSGGTVSAAGAAGAAPSAGAPSAGAPGSAGSSSGLAGVGAAGAASSEPADDGGCSLSSRSAGSKSVLALLVGLVALGRRRRASR